MIDQSQGRGTGRRQKKHTASKRESSLEPSKGTKGKLKLGAQTSSIGKTLPTHIHRVRAYYFKGLHQDEAIRNYRHS